ncbi:hypothetical protein D3C84_571120 [compost metagenome]
MATMMASPPKKRSSLSRALGRLTKAYCLLASFCRALRLCTRSLMAACSSKPLFSISIRPRRSASISVMALTILVRCSWNSSRLLAPRLQPLALSASA